MLDDFEMQRFLHRCNAIIDSHKTITCNRSSVKLTEILPQIIHQSYALRMRSICVDRDLLPHIVLHWTQLKSHQDLRNRTAGHLFNPLASIPIDEPIHSRLLGDLLDPNGSHSQGHTFLAAFLEQIGVSNPHNGAWMISVETGRVDICLWRLSPASVILIENKSNWAVDQPNQLYRYWYENIYKPYPQLDYSEPDTKKSFQIIYLAPTSGKHPDQQSIHCPKHLESLSLPHTLTEAGITIKVITFRDHITTWLDRCHHLVPSTNTRLKAYLQFYKELWS